MCVTIIAVRYANRTVKRYKNQAENYTFRNVLYDSNVKNRRTLTDIIDLCDSHPHYYSSYSTSNKIDIVL